MRLEVMARDGFACRICEEKNKTLSVHHTYYERDIAPWSYPAWSLLTLCENCHVSEEQSKDYWDAEIAAVFRHLGAYNLRMERICLLAGEIAHHVGPAAALSVIERALDGCLPAKEP